MKGAVFGAMCLGGVGTAAYVSNSGPNDYIGTVNRPPEAVYSAFAASMGPEGVTALPSHDGWPARFSQRVTKVANEEVLLELVVDQVPLVTMEIAFAPEGENATRVAAEVDIDATAIAQFADGNATETMAALAMGERWIDYAFAESMAEMVEDVEKGRPLVNLAAMSRHWGRENRPLRSSRNDPSAYRGETIRPDTTARPMVNPNEAALRHRVGAPASRSGWGSER